MSAATNQAGFSASSFGFFQSVKVCALSLLESTGSSLNGTRVAGTQLTGFDTHSAQGQLVGVQAELFSWLSYAIRSLRVVLSGAATDPRGYPSIWNNTVVVTLSEFGRTTIENGRAEYTGGRGGWVNALPGSADLSAGGRQPRTDRRRPRRRARRASRTRP